MKNNTKVIIALIAIALAALLAAFIFARFTTDSETPDVQDSAVSDGQETEYEMPEEEIVLEDDPTTKDYDNGIYFDEETEDAAIETKKASENEFIGSWEATSGQAAYLYGNVELKIETNGKWTGTITDEPLKGRWQKQGDGLYLTSEIFNCTLTFTSDGTLIMQEDYEETDEEAPVVVLTRK